MKAWFAKEKDGDYTTVVFAETRGKAKALALTTETCEDCDFCKLEVYRAPNLDKYYTSGKTEMDWLNPKDRIALVIEADFYCVKVLEGECKECPAKQWCQRCEEDLEYDKR